MNFTKSLFLKLFCVISLLAMSSAIAKTQTIDATPAPGIRALPVLSPEEMAVTRGVLTSLGYWMNLKASGFDASMRHALIAFQKVEGRSITGIVTTDELTALQTAHKPMPLEAGASHIEVDLLRQVLFVVDESGVISHILPISSGTGQLFTQGGKTRRAVTPLGRFVVGRKILGWHKSPLGLLYYPNYIHGGIAIHGNPAVPITPASHGCIRIPMFASKEFSVIVTVGVTVLVHDGTPLPLPEKLPNTAINF